MAITSVAGVNAGVPQNRSILKNLGNAVPTGQWTSSWFLTGNPPTGVADITTSGGVVRSNSSAQVTGTLPFYDPGSGNSYVATLRASIIGSGGPVTSLTFLADRLWDCGWDNTASAKFDPTKTVAQTITTSATWPARDESGSTNGVGVFIAVEVSTTLGAGSATMTLTYTNSSGTGSHTGTAAAIPSFGGATSFCPVMLQAGDVGVRSVQSIQANVSQTSGQWILVAYRILCAIPTFSSLNNTVDAVTSGFPRLYNGTVPFFLWQNNLGNQELISANLTVVQG